VKRHLSIEYNYIRQSSFNPLAVGSSPTRPTKNIKDLRHLGYKPFFRFSPNYAKLDQNAVHFK
jgi:hypothetical protein